MELKETIRLMNFIYKTFRTINHPPPEAVDDLLIGFSKK